MKTCVFCNVLRPFKKSSSVLFSFLAMLLALFVLCGILSWISFQNKIFVTYTQNEKAGDNGEELFITMEIPYRSDGEKNCWQQDDGSWGSQYDIFIHNRGMYPFVDWTLEMTVPEESRIDSSWNGEYTHTPGCISIKGEVAALNITVMPDSNVKVGFVLYTNELMESCRFQLSGRFLRNPFKDKGFLIALSFFVVFFLAFIVTIVLFFLLEKQKAKDEEKIVGLLKLCARFIDVRDEYTKMHSAHVGYYAKKIAEKMGFSEDFQRNIYYMGMMHDVGKVMISRDILCKEGRLTDEQWQEMKRHTIYGAKVLKDFYAVPGIHEAALCHHERWDGTGYQQGLKGEEIPIQARIIAVADAYDAMHTDRSYRPHLSDEVILQELEKNKGTQFDPKVAQAMYDLLTDKKKPLVYEP